MHNKKPNNRLVCLEEDFGNKYGLNDRSTNPLMVL